ncbi:hypothetical protein AKG07_13675 [Microbacterium sp. CGR1]|uniref:BREX-1 system adenine-specific DNA-methyltransferase PglX n=1 Tax=Microbacterium sp. CGR1 TaxID=1696072 RepID=UPI00069F37E8|nr:BREX-1 system adenine-specific DNA-methyltransferase PglX [Microbacterium sp. CGR1]AKV87169.1 hypothetical protein AKG07_13675 [Microbacterium sp. CGR1]
METATLKSFATKARTDLIKEVGARVSVVLAENSLARVESLSAVRRLEQAIVSDGRDEVVDRVAYTWFNRIIALRFMDANGYTPSAIVSPEVGRTTGQPEVLAEAKAGTFDSSVVPAKTQETITALFNRTRPSQDPDGEAYGLLLEAYCRSWHKAMPFMFEREGDYTELLIPAALLAVDSVRDRAVKTLTGDVCRDVEVIGWLYQFYISERKDEVFDGFKKNRKAGAAEIPAATQLFTPHWIVRYLVENSLGRLWLLNNPSSRLAEQMDYYIEPADEESDFLKITKPEELKVIDPAAGSGHMLTYAFDLLYAIYTERGYDPAEIPGLILQHNLYGTEIDQRAGALAAFALTMKAAAKRKLFLKNPIQPNVCVLENVHFEPAELDFLWSLTDDGTYVRGDLDEFWNAFEHADTFGSLIQPNVQLSEPLKAAIDLADADGDIIHAETLHRSAVVLQQANYLSQRYSVVVANPPYMGSKSYSSLLRELASRSYPESWVDLCTMFVDRGLGLVKTKGIAALVTSESWIFTTSFAGMRSTVLKRARPIAVAAIDRSAFGVVLNTAATVLLSGASLGPRTTFFRISASVIAAGEVTALPPASAEVHELDVRIFNALPSAPFAFDFPAPLLRAYLTTKSVGSDFDVKQGLATGDNDRFLRYWWEVSQRDSGFDIGSRAQALASGRRWFLYNKGGSPIAWWGNQEHVIDWAKDGEAVIAEAASRWGSASRTIKNTEFYFRPCITWSKTGTNGAKFRLLPQGSIFDINGMSIFFSDEESALNLLGYLNSQAARDGLDVLAPTLTYQSGDVSRLPHITGLDDASRVSELVAAARAEWADKETAHGFKTSPLVRGGERPVAEAYKSLAEIARRRARQIAELEAESDNYWRRRILETSGGDESEVRGLIQSERPTPTFAEVASDLASFAVGCMFGRYSLDESGLILADQGSTVADYLSRSPNPSFMPDQDNVIPIVDGDWFEDDIAARFRTFLRAAFGEEHFEENLRFVTDSLGVKDIRDYFVKWFYGDHVKRYKKRPIYWLFRSPKGSFSALIYLHRYTPSTASTVLTGYLREFIGKLEANLEHQERVASGIGGASTRDVATALKEADRIRKVLVELRDYEHDVLFPLAGEQIVLDLDDGVLVNYQKLGAALKDIGLKKGGGGE